MDSIKYTLERIEAETDIKTFVRDYVNIEEFLECCRKCPNYEKVWSCPPYDFDPMDYWNSFERILVAGYRITFEADRTQETMTEVLWAVKQKLADEMYALEKEFPGSKSLSAGTCHICKSCSKPDGAPCRFPDKMRFSIESIGGNVGKTISKLCGVEIEWIEDGKLPEHLVLVGGLLKK